MPGWGREPTPLPYSTIAIAVFPVFHRHFLYHSIAVNSLTPLNLRFLNL